MKRNDSGGCLLMLLFLPFAVLGELMKPKNLYSGGWYKKRRK